LPRQIAQRVRAILRLGLPIGGLIALEVGVFSVAGILMGLFGADALAAHQLALNVASLTFMIPLGIGQAATVRVAFELGASAPRAAHLARRRRVVSRYNHNDGLWAPDLDGAARNCRGLSRFARRGEPRHE